MNNLLSYCGLVNAKIRASDKDLPVIGYFWFKTDLVDFLLRKQIYWVAKVVHGFEFIASNSNQGRILTNRG